MEDHLASIARQTGTRPALSREAEEDPECPEVLAYLWDWFVELAARRTGGAVGPNPITHGEIADWARLTGREPEPWEIRLLLQLDDAALAVLREEAK